MWLYIGLIRVTYWFVRLYKNFIKIFTWRYTFAALVCGYRRHFAHVYRMTPALQSLGAQQLPAAGSDNAGMARPGLDLMCKCKPHTTAQSQEQLRTNKKPSLCPRVSTFIDPNGKSKKICRSSVNQKTPRWGAGRNEIDQGRMIPVGIRKSQLRFQDQDWRKIRNKQ